MVGSITTSADIGVSEALRTVAVNGAHHASRALSKWLRRGVHLRTDGFVKVPVSEASSVAGDPSDVIAAVYLPLSGDLNGHLLLTFSESVALTISDIMLQAPAGTAKSFGELEQSCLCETGNIVSSAYANSLAKWLRLHVEPSAPTFAHDMVSSILDPLITDLAMHHDDIYVARTDFHVDGQQMDWGLWLFPSEASLRLMEERCRFDAIRDNALQTIAINGAFNASRAMSKWLKRGVKIATDGFSRVPLNHATLQFDESQPIAAMHLPLKGQVHGHALLAFSSEHAMQLADILLEQPAGTTKEIGELEQSCLQETGNIIASAFVNSWSTWLDVHVEPAAPQFVFDLPGAVLESILHEQATVSDEVFMTKTEFIVNGQSLEWIFVLLPAPSAMRLIESSCE